ncbi:MAG: hypothetical protein R3C11_28710 [Planctomycetaceae bacterium]
MIRLRFYLTAFVIAAWVATSTGCSLMHNLQPHRLHRLNRQAPPASSAMYSTADQVSSGNPVNEFMDSTRLSELGE